MGKAVKIHKDLAAGLFESVYEEVLCYELEKEKVSFQRQGPIPVIYENGKWISD